MKHPGIFLLLSAIFLFLNPSSIVSQVEFGNRLYFQNNLEQADDGFFANVSQGLGPVDLQFGSFARKRFSTHFATRVEVNLTGGLYAFGSAAYYLLGRVLFRSGKFPHVFQSVQDCTKMWRFMIGLNTTHGRNRASFYKPPCVMTVGKSSSESRSHFPNTGRRNSRLARDWRSIYG
ncbi:MAG: hypothetical protein IPL27_15365 [Lewinellaceae bacterium]|nr:hypothetical protein [Lewinellaceae bacterium]